MRLSTFVIGLILVGVVATTFTMMILNLSTKHSVSYDNETLQTFGNTTTLHTLATDLEDKTLNQSTESGIVDIVGSYISKALDAMKLSIASFDVFENMASAATDKIGLPGYILKAIITIVLILIILGVIVSAMVKWLI